MRNFRLKTDLPRAVIDGFALPLGIDPGDLSAPNQGYTVAYVPGEEGEHDSLSFHVVVSHERVAPILHRAFSLLPEEIIGLVEVGSRDAYRSIDVYIGIEPLSREDFLESWNRLEKLLLEDCFIAAGANSEEPFVEIFLDQWKGITIHVPVEMRDEVESMLKEFDLEEVIETWPILEEERILGTSSVRPVIDLVDEYSPDIDELLLRLRHEWNLELNIDPEYNCDESGRNLGLTLWHAIVIVASTDGDPNRGAYASIWATAGSLAEMEDLIDAALQESEKWEYSEIYTIDRVAFDERPDELGELSPRRETVKIHHVTFESWLAPPEGVSGE